MGSAELCFLTASCDAALKNYASNTFRHSTEVFQNVLRGLENTVGGMGRMGPTTCDLTVVTVFCFITKPRFKNSF